LIKAIISSTLSSNLNIAAALLGGGDGGTAGGGSQHPQPRVSHPHGGDTGAVGGCPRGPQARSPPALLCPRPLGKGVGWKWGAKEGPWGEHGLWELQLGQPPASPGGQRRPPGGAGVCRGAGPASSRGMPGPHGRDPPTEGTGGAGGVQGQPGRGVRELERGTPRAAPCPPLLVPSAAHPGVLVAGRGRGAAQGPPASGATLLPPRLRRQQGLGFWGSLPPHLPRGTAPVSGAPAPPPEPSPPMLGGG